MWAPPPPPVAIQKSCGSSLLQITNPPAGGEDGAPSPLGPPGDQRRSTAAIRRPGCDGQVCDVHEPLPVGRPVAYRRLTSHLHEVRAAEVARLEHVLALPKRIDHEVRELRADRRRDRKARAA